MFKQFCRINFPVSLIRPSIAVVTGAVCYSHWENSTHPQALCEGVSTHSNSKADKFTSVASYIDHTQLKQGCLESEISKLCKEAKANHFAAVCVPPYWIAYSKSQLKGTDVKVATVIGFPFGYSVIEAKVTEIERAISDGVDEVDVVANISAIKRSDYAHIEHEINEVMKAVKRKKGLVCKVIIESGVLTDEQIIRLCEIYGKANINFLKTSTGFAEAGASVHAVELFRSHLPAHIQIKASGGIRTVADARAMIAAGATRLGCSAGVSIIQEEQAEISGSSSTASRTNSNNSSSY